ncbi:MAG: MopE-related protein, partial [bacterium]|nr:MopE-related protein [bacterium]
ISTNGDCDDTDSAINPDADEVCDEIDNDCDGDIDDDDSGLDTSTTSEWYADIDEDGYGDPSNTTESCAVPSGYLSDDTDCDDLEPDINPDADEVCDEIDNNCDGDIDDDDSAVDSSTYTTYCADTDTDGYGDPDDCVDQCAQPSGYVADDTDCDDTDSSVITGTWYADSDGDGFGDPDTTQSTCTEPSGYVSDDQDCDDTDSGVNPDAVELYFDLSTATETDNCDGVDSDCDGDIDEGCTDEDGDGVDDGAQLLFACDVDGSGYENSFCFPQAFTGAWEGEDCMYTLSPFTSITTSAAKTPVTVTFGGNSYEDTCYINGGGSTGDLYTSAVSSIGSDGSTAVDTTDTSDWIYADFGWCDSYTSSYCYGSSSLPSSWGAQIYWDGAEVSVP